MKKYLILLMILSAASVCMGGDSIPIPDYFKGTPFSYHGVGTIDIIGDSKIVIGDRDYLKAQELSIHDMKTRFVSRERLTIGDYAGFRLNKKREVSEIYLIKDYD